MKIARNRNSYRRSCILFQVGQQPAPVKHFTLKRKPKSSALRAELLQKSSDAQSHSHKISAPIIPLRSRGLPRKMSDTTPLRGIPSRVPTSGFRSPTVSSQGQNRPNMPRQQAGRKDGGIKLLDITEQPLGYAAAKKRKRQQDLEEQQKRALETQSSPTLKVEAETTPVVTTPDYAAGLNATPVYTQPATPAPLKTETTSVPLPASTTNQTQYTSNTEFIKPEIVKTETIESTQSQTIDAVASTPAPIISKNSTVVSNVSLASTNNIISSSNTIANNHIVFSIKSDGNVASSSVAASSIAATVSAATTTKKIDGPRIISSTTIKPALTLVTGQTPVKSLRPPALTSIVSTPNTMPSLAALSNTLSTQQQLSQPMQIPQQIGATKIVQIKTAPTIQMVPSANVPRSSIQNIPPLIPTQQPTILNIQQNVSLANRQQPITIHTQTSSPSTISYITTSQAQLQQQQQQQPSTIQLATGQQKYTPVMMSSASGVKGKTIILANPPNVSQQKTIILRSVGPDGNAVYQQVPISNVSGLQNLTGNNNMILTTQTPGLIKTSTHQQLQQQPQYQQIQTTATHQNHQLPALVPTSYAPMVITSTQNNQQINNQQQTQSGTTLRPLLVTNSQGLNILPQGLTLIQRPGQQAQLVQTIQQPQTIRLQQQPQIVQIQQQPQAQQVQLQPQRTIVTSQPQTVTHRKGLTLSVSSHHFLSPRNESILKICISEKFHCRTNMLPN